MVRLDPQYRLVFGAGGELRARPTSAQMGSRSRSSRPPTPPTCRASSPTTGASWTASGPCWKGRSSAALDLVDPALLKMLPLLRPWLSLDGELARYFADPRVRLAFSFQSKYLGMSPFNCPSLFSILSFLEYEYGVWHPIGGCGAVIGGDGARRRREMGVALPPERGGRGDPLRGPRAVGVRTEPASTGPTRW